jgi:predicted  nucleic acid-binding Zn-ribbon protein
MTSTTYQDLIDNKIAHWQDTIRKIEERVGQTGSDSREEARQSLQKLRDSFASAQAELHEVSSRETVQNTLAVKDQILKIFDSIDRELTAFDESTPFML